MEQESRCCQIHAHQRRRPCDKIRWSGFFERKMVWFYRQERVPTVVQTQTDLRGTRRDKQWSWPNRTHGLNHADTSASSIEKTE